MIQTNFQEIADKLENISRRLYKKSMKTPTEARKILSEFGRDVHNSIVYSMLLDPKTGHIYKYKRRYYQASAPGESPAVRSGKLIKAIAYTTKKDQIEIGVLKRVKYGKYLEPDTAAGLRNRPFLKTNIDYEIPKVKAKIMDRVLVLKKGEGFGI